MQVQEVDTGANADAGADSCHSLNAGAYADV